jgi:putative aldouronate transport system permease protein
MRTAGTRRRGIRGSAGDRVFDAVNTVVMAIVLFLVVYVLYFVLIASVSDPYAVARGETILRPVKFGLQGYEELARDPQMWLSYRNSVLYTTVGTLINIAVTMSCAYALAKRDLPGVTVISLLIVFTMLFDGGMIPRYLIVKRLGLVNTMWAVILPRAAWVFCIMIARTFIQETIPAELYEAAQVEGCSFARYFFEVVLPLSPALISILVLYYGVGHWNSFFDAMIYLDDRSLFPLQLVLRNILIANRQAAETISSGSPELLDAMIKKAETIKYSVIIFASLPVLCLYPFLQKYFVKGIMIGAIKG